MSLDKLFSRYGHPSDEAEERIYIYLTRASKLDTTARIIDADGRAALLISEMEKYIADLREYRKTLAERYAQLETMNYCDTLIIERQPSYYGGIKYFVRITRAFEDGTKQDILIENYTGKDRHKALARYEELKKSRPGIKAEKDIERRQWER